MHSIIIHRPCLIHISIYTSHNLQVILTILKPLPTTLFINLSNVEIFGEKMLKIEFVKIYQHTGKYLYFLL